MSTISEMQSSSATLLLLLNHHFRGCLFNSQPKPTQFAFFDTSVRQRLAEVAGATVDRIDVRVSRRGRR